VYIYSFFHRPTSRVEAPHTGACRMRATTQSTEGIYQFSSADKAEVDRYLAALDKVLYDVWQSKFANFFKKERDARIDKYNL